MTQPENERIGPAEARYRGGRGVRGERGPKGERGAAGLSPQVRRALVVLFLLPSLISIIAVIGLVVQERDQRALQARQGQMVEQKLCTTFGQLAALKPPAGNPETNPSRGYLQREHATLVRLGSDLGCGSRAG